MAHRGDAPLAVHAPPGGCTAPWTALYFDPTGLVLPCCVSHGYEIGRIGASDRPSLLEMWRGAAAERLRRAIATDDFGLGCQECDPALAGGGDTQARGFDRYVVEGDQPFPRVMDFALSNTCNLQCVMCNGTLSSAIRAHREHRAPLPSPYDDRFFDELRAFLPHLERCLFKGGEPFLGREPRRVWDLLLELGCTPEVLTVTNGTIWNDRVEHYVRSLRMSLCVSIDGITNATMGAIRVGATHDEVAANIGRFRDLTAELGTSLALNFCLQPDNWSELGRFLAWAEELGVDVNVIRVTFPARYDLASLPPDRLAEIVRSLQQEGSRLALDRLRPRFEQQVAMLEVALRRPGVESPVAVRSPRGPDLAAELGRWSGRPVLVAVIDGDSVAAVDAPAWSRDWLAPDEWTGGLMTEIPGHLERRLGGRVSVHRVHRGDGVDEFSLDIEGAGTPLMLRLVVADGVTGAAAATGNRLLLAYRGDLPSPAGPTSS